jgi:non-specific serine/threonine protein kinase/serine/threonine-protein kinase
VSTPNDHDPSREAPAPDETIAMPSGADQAGNDQALPTKIGPYTIKRVIASGGMGTVYEALQENPRRPAAVKVIRRSMASGEALRRFEREAQALARLRHPGIAQIYEAGTYQDGGTTLPFFALEYIPNAKNLLEFARAKNLDVRQKLELFQQVCEAVHYGHQRGIIHRDLKPGNILVDSEGRVRVIDFGVARAVDADQEQADFQTQVGQIVGTAQYMSPEQFEADPNDLDTRSDVYALGVVLYELLSGQLPYAFAQSGVFEIARIVRKEQPTALGAAVPGIDGELELITAKALQKDREARYQSAFGLAQDIVRHLKGEAISAKPTSLSYQARVFARKNKAVVGLASAAVALLVVGVVWTSKLYVDVSAARTRSEASAEQAIAANEFLKGALASVVPPGFGDVRTIGDLCDQVAQDIDGAFPDSPITEADIRHTIGHIYMRLDKRDQSEFQLKKAYLIRAEHLGRRHESSRQALNDLNTYYYIFGPAERFLATAQEQHEIMVEMLGPTHRDALEAKRNWIDGLEFVGKYNRAARVAGEYRQEVVNKWGETSPEAMEAIGYHATIQLRDGQTEAALASGSKAFELCSTLAEVSSTNLRTTKNVYASTLIAAGDLDAAKELYGHRKAPDSFGIDLEYQGSLGAGGEAVQVLVFFETWCPYSQRYIPILERLNRQYGDLGVEMVGLTAVNRSSSDANVRQFITANEMSFTVLKENGRCSNYFDLDGVPMTVILHEGEVIWDSSGAGWLDSHMLEGIVNAEVVKTH